MVHDAVACYDEIEQSAFSISNELYILGHSEGTITAAQVSGHRPATAGIILLNPFVQDMESTLIEQARHNESAIKQLKRIKGAVLRNLIKLSGNPITSQRKLIDRIRKTDSPIVRFKLNKIPAKWLRELLALDSRKIFRELTCPILLIGGEKDIQCNPDDVSEIAKLSKVDTETHVINDLFHILRLDEREPSIFGYKELLKKPVDPIVLELISNWLKCNG